MARSLQSRSVSSVTPSNLDSVRPLICSNWRSAGDDVVAGGDVELERMPGGEPQLVEPVHVPRIRDRDVDTAVLILCVRDRHHALEHVVREQLHELRVDSRHLLAVHDSDDRGQVDVRHPVLQRQHAGDAVARRNLFLLEGGAERAGLLGALAYTREPVLRDELGRRKEFDGEEEQLVAVELRLDLPAMSSPRLVLLRMSAVTVSRIIGSRPAEPNGPHGGTAAGITF